MRIYCVGSAVEAERYAGPTCCQNREDEVEDMSKIRSSDIDTAQPDELREALRNQRRRLGELQFQHDKKALEVESLRERVKILLEAEETRARVELEEKRRRAVAEVLDAIVDISVPVIGSDTMEMVHDIARELSESNRIPDGSIEKVRTYQMGDVEIQVSFSVTHVPTSLLAPLF